MMNTKLSRQTLAKTNIHPPNPIKLAISGKNFKTTNPPNDITIIQNVTPKSFIFCGIISAGTAIGSVVIASDATNRVNEQLTIGIQLNASTS